MFVNNLACATSLWCVEKSGVEWSGVLSEL